jgi:phosphoheptose isomerase
MYGVKILIDGQPMCEIAKGGAATFQLLAGLHRVEVSGGGLSNAAAIHIADGVASRYHLDFSALGALGGGLKFKPL